MLGLMMNRPLMISALLQHAAQNHNDTEIVSRLPVGGTHRYTYGDAQLPTDIVHRRPVDDAGHQAGGQYRDGRSGQRNHQMACQPTVSSDRAGEQGLSARGCFLLL